MTIIIRCLYSPFIATLLWMKYVRLTIIFLSFTYVFVMMSGVMHGRVIKKRTRKPLYGL